MSRFLRLLCWCSCYGLSGLVAAEQATDLLVDKPIQASRLFLPKSYQHHRKALHKAAEAALSQPRCVEILQATIDLHQSRTDNQLFRIICRDPTRTSFTLMMPSESEIPLGIARKPLCQTAIEEKTHLMQKQKWLGNLTAMPVPTLVIAKDGVQRPSSAAPTPPIVEAYFWDFDAESIDGEALTFTAICSIDALNHLSVLIRPRALAGIHSSTTTSSAGHR